MKQNRKTQDIIVQINDCRLNELFEIKGARRLDVTSNLTYVTCAGLPGFN